MINSDQADVLQLVIDEKFDEIQNFYSFSNLRERKYIDYTGAGTLYVTDIGLSALEEYKRALMAIEHNTENLRLAKKAIRLSIGSFILSIVAVVSSILIGILC